MTRMLSFASAVLLAAGALLQPCAAEAQSSAAKATSATHVYFLRGFMGVFSMGLDEMASQLRERSIQATVHGHTDWSSVASEAIAEYKAGRARTLMFVGHSMGAGAALQAAEKLKEAGVPVRLIVTLDLAERIPGPSNVQRIVNLYFPTGMGEPAVRAKGSRGTVENIRLPDNSDYGHFSMSQAPQIQRQVMAHVLAASGAKTKEKRASR